MELNERIRGIELPKRMARLPVSSTGFPVPKFVHWQDGVPDFRVIEPGWVAKCFSKRLCWLCGEPMGRFMTFVIGPMCAINRVSSEPPSHRDCAIYAAKACPFLSQPRMRRNERDLPEGGAMGGIAVMHNPGVSLVYTTHGYHPINDGRGGVLFQLDRPIECLFYRESRLASRDEVLGAIDKGRQKRGSRSGHRIEPAHPRGMGAAAVMKYVIRQVSPPGKSARADEATAVALTIAAASGQVHVGKYLEWSDPNAKTGMGDDRWTDDPAKAKRFDSFEAASACWKAQSKVIPRRPDGKPNRPLTAYSVSIEKIGD